MPVNAQQIVVLQQDQPYFLQPPTSAMAANPRPASVIEAELIPVAEQSAASAVSHPVQTAHEEAVEGDGELQPLPSVQAIPVQAQPTRARVVAVRPAGHADESQESSILYEYYMLAI